MLAEDRNADFSTFYLLLYILSILPYLSKKCALHIACSTKHNSERNAKHANQNHHWMNLFLTSIFSLSVMEIWIETRLMRISSYQKFWMFIHISNWISLFLFLNLVQIRSITFVLALSTRTKYFPWKVCTSRTYSSHQR